MLCVPVNLDKYKYKDTMTNTMIHRDIRTNRRLSPPVNLDKDKYKDTRTNTMIHGDTRTNTKLLHTSSQFVQRQI